jgi:hypothetical protein
MSNPDEGDRIHDELRTTIHKLNNLLAAIVVQSEAILLDPEAASTGIRRKADSILTHATEAERVLVACRRELLDTDRVA